MRTAASVTVEFTGRLEDGTVFDTTRPSVAGETGTAEALLGLAAGNSKTVSRPPEAASGEWNETQVREYGADEFAERLGGQQPEEGTFIERQDGSLAELTHADDESVRVDFNHRPCVFR